MIKKSFIKLLHHFKNDSLFRNSIYLMASTGVMGIFGFVFWIINARFYSPEQIGIATFIISSASLAAIFSNLGFNNAFIRFLPISIERNKLLSLGFLLCAFASIITSGFFFFFIHNKIVNQYNNSIFLVFSIFLSYVILLTLNNLLDSAFIAFKSAKFVLIKNTIFSLVKLILPVFLISLNYLGIIGAIVTATFVSVIFGFTILIKNFDYNVQFNKNINLFKQVGKFTFGNYIGNIFGILPTTLVPIIVVSELGASSGAFFYMPLMIVSFLNVIPSATAQSFFSESSHEENKINLYLLQAIKNSYLLLIPLVILVLIFADNILNLFGSEYSTQGATALRIMSVASLISGANYLGDTILNVKKNIGSYIFMNAFNSIIIVGLVYLLAPGGIAWVAMAGLIGQSITLIIYFIINKKIILNIINTKVSNFN